ncbi:MAG: aminotransferase class IV [Fibrobacterales bacterium]
MNYAFVNGEIVEASKATVSIFDRGLILGDGLFETVKAIDGVPEFFSDHWNRLESSAKKLLIELPYDESFFESLIGQLCDKSQLSEAAVRITITRGVSPGLSIDPAICPTVIVTASPITWLNESLYTDGVAVAITSVKRSSASGIDGHIKTTNYLANIMAKHEADKKGAYEGIFLSEKGEIAEMTTSSFFCVAGGILYTPPLDADILPGITRQQILKAAKELDVPISEKHIHPTFLERAEESFLTSSVRGVVPICTIEGYSFGTNGPITRLLREKYSEMSLDYLKKHNTKRG